MAPRSKHHYSIVIVVVRPCIMWVHLGSFVGSFSRVYCFLCGPACRAIRCCNFLSSGGWDLLTLKKLQNMTLSKQKWPSQCGSSQYNYYWSPDQYSGVILDRVSFHGRFVHFHLPSFLPSDINTRYILVRWVLLLYTVLFIIIILSI